MNREFLKFYNQELAILREQAAEFAQEYPGVAERLGGLLEDNLDPMIGGLLEGAAFLAAQSSAQAQARVLRLHHEPDRPAGAALSGADAVVRARAGEPEIRRSEPARRADDRARRQFRRDLSRGAAQRRLPVHAGHADHPLAVRNRQGRIPDQRRRRAGADPGRRRRCAACLRLQLTVRAAARIGGRAGRQGGVRRGRSFDSRHAG